MWDEPQINFDGKLLGCCINRWGDYGNVFKEGLDACMAGEKYIYAKNMVLGLSPQREDVPCSMCKYYNGKMFPVA